MTSAIASDTAAVPALRTSCSYCCVPFEIARVESASIPSNVRRFVQERFTIWRCPRCRSLHCREVVDLARYYENYPIGRTLSNSMRVALDNLRSRLVKHGLAPTSRVLDYGCGWGLFRERARECGFPGVVGYDPYSAVPEFRDRRQLAPLSFEYVLLQDVLEHVEDPRELLRELDGYLKPGGVVLIGTPNADEIALAPYAQNWFELHPPYHLHVYTRAAVEGLGAELGWRPLEFVARSYFDTRVNGVNTRVLFKYGQFGDGTLDALLDYVAPEQLRRSIRFQFWTRFGYWFRRPGNMTLMFRKP